MVSLIRKFSYGVLCVMGLTLSVFLAEGQNDVGQGQNDQQITINLRWVFDKIGSYFREANDLTQSVRTDIQNLNGKIDELKNPFEDCQKSINSSNQEVIRQLVGHNRDMISQIQILQQKLDRSHCPSGFNYTASNFPKCYAVLTEPANWNTAQQQCRQLNNDAHLAVINNALEQQIISRIILNYDCLGTVVYENGKTLKMEYYWIGAERRSTTDCKSPFVWKPDNRTTMEIDYSNWHPGEPNCQSKIENTLALRKNGEWNDLAGKWTFCSICEVIASA